MSAMVLSTLALAIIASGEVNVERLDGTRVTRLNVRAADESGTLGAIASGPLGPAVIYDSEPTGYISGCSSHSCMVGFADEMRFSNIPLDGTELRSYTFSYAAGYGYLFGFCVPGKPGAGDCDCYCPTGGECDEGDPPYTINTAIYDGPPGLCGGGLPIAGTEAEIVTTASRPLGNRAIEVTVHLDSKVFVPDEVWGVVSLDIEDAWLAIGTAPTVGSTYQDGALWLDSDADGCWDEWDCWPDPYPWGCPGCTGWMHFEVKANAEVVFSLVPVPPPSGTTWADLYTYEIDDGEALLAVGGEPIWMEIRVSDFDPNQTGVLLKAWHVTVDASGYGTGLQGTLEPFSPACTSDEDCLPVGSVPTCVMSPECLDTGLSCSQCEFLGSPCTCLAGFIDSGRADYIFFGEMELNATDLETLNYRYAATLMAPPMPSRGGDSYLGSLVLWVPEDAKGTSTINFVQGPDTSLLDSDSHFIPLVGLMPAKVTVELGACCFGLGAGDKKQGCIDDVTVAECEYIGLCKGFCEDNVGFRCQSDVECTLQGATGPCIGGATLGQVCYPSGLPPDKGPECDTAAGEACVIQGGAGFSPNASCDDPSFNCIGCSLSDPPTTEVPAVATNRYLSLVPANVGRRSALRVTFNDLPAPYDAWNQVSMWVGPPVEYCENSGQDIPPPEGCGPAPGQVSETFFASTLHCDPFFMDWQGVCIGSSCTGGLREGETCAEDTDCASTIHVYHEGIIPSAGMPADPESFVPASYDVQAVGYACDVSLEDNYSASLTMANSKWGDTVGDCATQPCSPPNRRVNVTTDITALVNNFQNLSTAPSQARSDLVGSAADALVDQRTMIVDLTAALQAFTGLSYPPATFPPLGDRPCAEPAAVDGMTHRIPDAAVPDDWPRLIRGE